MPSSKPILFISNKLVNPNAGTESQLLQLIRNLPRDQFQPRLLVLQRSEFTDSGEVPCPVDVLGHSKLLDLRTWIAFRRYVKQAASNGCQIAHIYFHDASVFGPPLLRSVGIAPVISRRDMGYWYNRLYLFILRISGKFVERVIVNSEAVGDITSREERIPGHKVEVIYNGYESPHGSVNAEARDVAELQGNGMGPLIFLVANYRPLKKIDDAIRALESVLRRGHYAQMVVVGSGNWEPLENLASELGIENQVHFLGRRTDVDSCLSHGYAGILCSESEGYSNSIVEYMQASLPVVATDVGGNKEAVIEGETGFLYSVGDIEALSRKLIHLLDNPDIAKRMGQSGCRLATRRHDLHQMVNRHVDIYSRLLRARDSAMTSQVD